MGLQQMMGSIHILSSKNTFSMASCAEAKALDASLIKQGTPGVTLMQRAGEAAFELLREHWPRCRSLLVLCGSGNNAGDAYVVAATAAQYSYDVTLFYMGDPSRLSKDASSCRISALNSGVDCRIWQKKDMSAYLTSCAEAVIVDGLLGLGFKAPLRKEYLECIRLANESHLPSIALDVPSGLNVDTGYIPQLALKADLTISFLVLKRGLCTGDAKSCVGGLYLNDLGVDTGSVSVNCRTSEHRISEHRFSDEGDNSGQSGMKEVELSNIDNNLRHLPARERNSHKGDHGRVLVIAGAKPYGGAGILCSVSCLAGGAGLVTLVTHESYVAPALAHSPELMVHGLPDRLSGSDLDALRELMAVAEVCIIGPGLSQDFWGESLFDCFLEYVNTHTECFQLGCVIDADALNLLSKKVACPESMASTSLVQSLNPTLPEHSLLTPHPGEASRLLSCSASHVQSDRYQAAVLLQQKFGVNIVLKGAGTIMAHGSDNLSVCPYGNPSMAVAGMGDVLSGVIGALLAQKLSMTHATELGVCAHSYAADHLCRVQGEVGLRSSQLIPCIRDVLNNKTLAS